MRSSSLLICNLIGVICVGLVWTVVVQAAPPAQDVYLPLIARPATSNDSLNVNPQLDAGRAVSAAVPLAGGQIVATASDNTRFTLSIPSGTLNQTTTITLTPVVQITGLPNVQLVGAVEIEPLNVLLLQAVTLKIEPAQAVPVDQEYPFAYYGDGQDFHPFPIQPYSKGLIYPIGKFDGGYGIARTSTKAMTAGADAPAFTPADPEAQLRSQMAALIHLERERILQSQAPDPTLWPKVRDLALQYYNTVIKPLLQPSTVDCAFAKANMVKAIGWLRSIMLLFGDMAEPGGDPAFLAASAEIMDALIKAMENCYRKAAAPCMDWQDPEQVDEVLSHYRSLALMGAEENVTSPFSLPECIFVDASLQGGAFHYTFARDPESDWDQSVHFQFVDDTVSSVGFYYPFVPKGVPLPGPSAIISITALIDDVWQSVPLEKRFFCRDQKAERLQELVITFAEAEGEPALPPQLYADNIGCWRWTGTVQHDTDYAPLTGVPEFYFHTSGQITLERDPNQPYSAYESLGQLRVTQVGYLLVSPSAADYSEKLHHVDDEGNTTCLQTITAHIDDPATYSIYPAMDLPNAGFGLPRQVAQSAGSALNVNLPYTTQGWTCPGEGQSVDQVYLPLAGDLSADGRHIYLDETGPTSNGLATFHELINLQAQRE